MKASPTPSVIKPCWAHYGYKPEMEEKRLESMLSWNIDGLILTERTHTPRTLKAIEVAGIPVVELMDSQSPCLLTLPSVSITSKRRGR